MEGPRHPRNDVRRRIRDAPGIRVLRDQVRDAPRHPAPLVGESERARCLHYQFVSNYLGLGGRDEGFGVLTLNG